MAKNEGNGAFIFGMILGALGGAVAGLLYTPRSGEELRNEIGSRVTQTAGPAIEKAQPYVNQGKERATGLIDRAAERAQDVSGKIAAMDLPFQEDEGVHVDPAPAPPTPAEPFTDPGGTPKPSV